MMKAKINGVELEASTADELRLLIDVVKTTPEFQKAQEPSALDSAWDWTCEAADTCYNTSTKDIVDGICSGFNSFIDWATTPSNK